MFASRVPRSDTERYGPLLDLEKCGWQDRGLREQYSARDFGDQPSSYRVPTQREPQWHFRPNRPPG